MSLTFIFFSHHTFGDLKKSCIMHLKKYLKKCGGFLAVLLVQDKKGYENLIEH
jgi:hypothetical protein